MRLCCEGRGVVGPAVLLPGLATEKVGGVAVIALGAAAPS